MTQPLQPHSIDRIIWWLLAAMAALCLVLGAKLGFRVDPVRALAPLAGLAALAAAIRWGAIRGDARLVAGATAFLQMTAFTVLGVVLAYALAAQHGALWDGWLAAADRRLGFDCPAFYRAADDAPVLLWIGGIAYHSLTVQMIACIVVLSIDGRADRLRLAILAAIGSGMLTILISGAMPAMGNVFDPADFHRLWPSIAWAERDLIAGLRSGTLRTLDLTQLMGIVSFPSYHATLPVILAWAQKDVSFWRIAAPVWAGVTIVATPLFGGHYGVDVLAGLALALAALAIIGRIGETTAMAGSFAGRARRGYSGGMTAAAAGRRPRAARGGVGDGLV